MVLAVILYVLTVLVPINGLLWMGIRRERLKNRRILLEYWRLRQRRG